jgi:hypothetical protein
MRLLPGLAVLPFCLAGAGLAEPLPFDGRWGWDVAACAYAPGESDMVPTVIANGTIRYYESHCTIDSVEPLAREDGAAWVVGMSCGGEGETWKAQSILAIDDGAGERRRQLIDIDLLSGLVTARQDCDWTAP